MEVERYLLGSALAGIISQKLARRLCKRCRGSRPTNVYEKKVFKEALNIEVDQIYTPVGCSECHAGYNGRIAIHEVLKVNQEIQDAITQNIDKSHLRKMVYSSGTITMLQDGLAKVVEGETTFDEIIKLIDLEDDLGSNSNLGLEATLEDSHVSNQAHEYELLEF